MLIHPRVIPVLLLKGCGLYKTLRFQDPIYLGDPINVVKIFNDKGVDELLFLDIAATNEKRPPNYSLIEEIATECFMPLGYGGGVRSIEDMEELFRCGVEKISINTTAVECLDLISEAAQHFGSQAVIVSIDVKKTKVDQYQVYTHAGKKNTGLEPVEFAQRVQNLGAGELLLNSIDRDGTMQGYDLDLIRNVSQVVSIPVIACGGAGSIEDLARVVKEGGASAAAAGSLFVFQGKHRAVLISYPEQEELNKVFSTQGK